MLTSEYSVQTAGLVDLQVNGFAGVDFNDPNLYPEAFEKCLKRMLSTGVTSCLPTLISGSQEHLKACFQALEKAREASDFARDMVRGYHLEGPFISSKPGFRGCHLPEATHPADPDFFARLQEAAGGNIGMITVAPEIEGVMALIETLSGQGIIVALGHTTAGQEQIGGAADAGAVLSTHLGNGTAPLLSKHDNPILAQLSEDRLSASFIADGYHLSREQLQTYLRAKGSSRTLLVTDATSATAASPGRYRLGQLKLERGREPVAYAHGTGRPVGSAVTLDQCVRNVIDWFGLSLEEAVSWASQNPKRILGGESTDTEDPDHVVKWIKKEGEWMVREAQNGSFVVNNTNPENS